MASPQKENGYFVIANELAEALAKTSLTPNENRVLWVVLRKTYGWNKKADSISLSQIEVSTCLVRWSVCRAIKGLISKNILSKKIEGRINVFCMQKNYKIWPILDSHGNEPINSHDFVPSDSHGNEPLIVTPHAEEGGTKMRPTKDNKDNLTKDRGNFMEISKEMVEKAKSEVEDFRKIGWSDRKIKDHFTLARGFTEHQADEAMGKRF